MFKNIFKSLVSIFVSLFLLSLFVILIFRFLPPPSSAFMIQQRFSHLFEGKNSTIEYEWISIDEISKNLQLAAIAGEDQKFTNHFGFDFDEINKALKDYTRGRRVRGASTITQQTAKNLFLFPNKNFFRKGLEAYFTILLEIFWSKKRILEVYLNIAEFGENTFGVYAASKLYFNTRPGGLSKRQSAMLIALLPNPKKFNSVSPSIHLQRRTAWIQTQMYQLGEGILSQL